jgi:hypothetical protein
VGFYDERKKGGIMREEKKIRRPFASLREECPRCHSYCWNGYEYCKSCGWKVVAEEIFQRKYKDVAYECSACSAAVLKEDKNCWRCGVRFTGEEDHPDMPLGWKQGEEGWEIQK